MASTEGLERTDGAVSGSPLVSIVTTSFNAARTIERTIESILSQRGDFDLEHIITDAGSSDGTRDIIRRFGSRVSLVDATGLGQSAGINLGFKLSKGEIVAFLNADDVYLPGTIARVVEKFRNAPHSLWLAGQCRIIDAEDRELQSWIATYKNFLLKRYSYFLLLTENFICQPAVFLSRKALERCGYFSESEHYVMDYDYWLRLGRLGDPIIVSEDLACFRRMPTTKSNRGFVQQFKDDMRVAHRNARETRNYLAIPLKAFNFVKTVAAYKILDRCGAL